jgi:hypothetical protein
MNRRGVLKLLLASPLVGLARGTLKAAGATPGHVFGADAGLIFNSVKPDHAANFEAVLQRLKAALHASADPVRKQQAAGWKIFKAVEPGANDSVLYVFWIEPAAKGADYTVSKILSEVFPDEVNDLYAKFSAAYSGGQTMVNLQLLLNMAQSV